MSFCSLVILSLSHPGLHLTLTGSERVSDPMLVGGHLREPDLGAGDRQGAGCSGGLSMAGGEMAVGLPRASPAPAQPSDSGVSQGGSGEGIPARAKCWQRCVEGTRHPGSCWSFSAGLRVSGRCWRESRGWGPGLGLSGQHSCRGTAAPFDPRPHEFLEFPSRNRSHAKSASVQETRRPRLLPVLPFDQAQPVCFPWEPIK